MTAYVARVEFGIDFDHAAAERVTAALAAFTATASPSDHENVQATLTVEAASPAQALAAIEQAGVAAGLGEALAAQVVLASEWDVRSGTAGESESDAVSVTEAAALLGVSRQRVHQLIGEQRIPATRIGHSYAIARADVSAYARGRPEEFLPF